MTVVASIKGFFAIPPSTKPTVCTCGKTVYFIKHRCKPKNLTDPGKESILPIAIHGDVRAAAPTDTTWGQGYSHFSNCPHAARHLKHRPSVSA